MRLLSAPLLAFLAAVPALVSAGDTWGDWPDLREDATFTDVIRHKISIHIDMAISTLEYIAENFVFDLDDYKANFVFPLDDRDWTAFSRENFVLAPDGSTVHVLCGRAVNRLETLKTFYENVERFVFPKVNEADTPPEVDDVGFECAKALSELELPGIPDAIRDAWQPESMYTEQSVDTADPSSEVGQIVNTDKLIQDWLISLADVLSTGLRIYLGRTKFGGRDSIYWQDWLFRIGYLDKAISQIQIFANEPLTAHGHTLVELLLGLSRFYYVYPYPRQWEDLDDAGSEFQAHLRRLYDLEYAHRMLYSINFA